MVFSLRSNRQAKSRCKGPRHHHPGPFPSIFQVRFIGVPRCTLGLRNPGLVLGFLCKLFEETVFHLSPTSKSPDYPLPHGNTQGLIECRNGQLSSLQGSVGAEEGKLSEISPPLHKATRKVMFNLGILHSTDSEGFIW
jgi:hypothetical protein